MNDGERNSVEDQALRKLRVEIDKIDADLVNLLNKRAEKVLEVRDAKQRDNIDIYSPVREKQIFDRVVALSGDGPFPKDELRRIFLNVVSATRSLIGESKVAYLGPKSSLGYDAALKQFGRSVDFQPSSSVARVFEMVESGQVAYGVVPLEQGYSGISQVTLRSFLSSSVFIVAEVDLEPHLLLLSKHVGLHELKKVYADAQFFTIAEKWLNENLPDVERILVPNPDFAINKAREDESVAVIVSEHRAEDGTFSVLACGLEEQKGERLRFVVIGNKASPPSGADRTSVLCSVDDRSGALHKVLEAFADEGVTLSKIESKQKSTLAADYLFYLDFLGHEQDIAIKRVMERLAGVCAFVKFLGSYPRVGDMR